jgi:hypothetical protein
VQNIRSGSTRTPAPTDVRDASENRHFAILLNGWYVNGVSLNL